MNTMLAYCGIACDQCPVLRATRADDEAQRAELAASWGKLLGRVLASADMNCDGCRAEEGRRFAHCRACAIRFCCRGHDLADCAACDDYPCPDLAALFDQVPVAREALEARRAGRRE